jgi:Spy/CpxP family protein refolding chaperone
MKILLPAIAAAMLVGAVATATPAQAKCWWNGFGWQCGSRHNDERFNERFERRDRDDQRHHGWEHSGGGFNRGEHNGWGFNR